MSIHAGGLLAVKATIATLRAMTLDRLTHLVIEEKNILKIMLKGASRDGMHMNFDFLQGLLVVLQSDKLVTLSMDTVGKRSIVEN